MAKRNSRLNSSILSADDGERRGETAQNPAQRRNQLARLDGERKGLALLLANEKGDGSFFDFLKSTEVSGREGARERELEWQRRSDQAGEELLEG